MKVRIYSPYFPYPVTEGAFQVLAGQIQGFAKYHDVEVVFWKTSLAEAQARVNSESLDGFWGARWICWAANTGVESGLQRATRTLTSLVRREASPGLFYYPPGLDRREALPPVDLAIYHYTYAWGWLSRAEVPQERKKVLYFHNIESDLFDHRAECESSSILRPIHRWNARKLRFQERDLANQVDAFWHISTPDARETAVRGIGSELEQSVRAPVYTEEFYQSRVGSFKTQHRPESPLVLGFIGGLDFDANRDSLRWILEEVAPVLEKKSFQGRMEVVGRKAPGTLIHQMKKYSFIHYDGFRKDLSSFWDEMSVMLVPHVSGSGVRIKLLDALASGIPVLANPAAVERVDGRLHESPLLTIHSRGADWADFIMGQKGQDLRALLSARDIEEGLTFEAVYPEFVGPLRNMTGDEKIEFADPSNSQ